MVLEVGIGVQILWWSIAGARSSPASAARDRSASKDVSRNSAVGPVPDSDALGGPLGCPNTSAVVVPSSSVTILDLASRPVGVGGLKTNLAISGSGDACHLVRIAIDARLALGVKRRPETALLVGALDDVDFAVSWPCATAESPEGWPGTTLTTWHVTNVGNDETLGELFVALNANTLAANVVGEPVITWAFVRVVIGTLAEICSGVDAHDSIFSIKANEAIVDGILTTTVGHEAMCWIGLVEEGPVIEEAGARVFLRKVVLDIRGSLTRRQSRNSKNGRNQRSNRNECCARPQRE